jgi:hypothetical protein
VRQRGVCVCARACVRVCACVRACVRVCACVRARVVSVCLSEFLSVSLPVCTHLTCKVLHVWVGVRVHAHIHKLACVTASVLGCTE